MPLRKLWKSASLQFQKLDTTLLNDIKLFIRDYKSLILVLLTPFLILSILINIYYFSDVTETIKGVEFGICDLDDSNFDLETEIFKTTKFTGDCNSTVAELVQQGELRGALIIPKGFHSNLEQGLGSEIILFTDNSKSTTALVTDNAVKAYVSDLNEKIGTEFILEAWKQLRTLNQNLRFLVTNLEKAKPTAIALQQRLDSINSEISTIDFNEHQESVNDIISFLNLMEIQLDYIDSTASTIPSIPQIPKLSYTPNASITFTQYRLSSLLFKKQYCNTTDPVCGVLNYSDSFINAFEQDVNNLSFYRDDINKKIAQLNNGSDALNQSLSRVALLIDSSSEENQELKQDINTLRNSLLFLEDKTENLSKTITELNQSLNKFLSDTIRVTNELNTTISVLDSYTQKDPSTILRPVSVDSRPVFKDKLQIFYRLPALMSIILLFITLFISSSLIVNERKGGTMARIFLSPISMFFYVFEKVLYLLILALLTVFSMLVAALIFQVPTTFSLNLLIVFIISSLAYITIGTLIGATSKSENSSLLTCLVIGFPLMFLSGAFSPPELMGRVARTITQYLPLTINIELLENITIYNTALNPKGILILAVMIVVFYLLTVLMIRKKPTLK
jgi:ABC-type multidrug transport system permease subunit